MSRRTLDNPARIKRRHLKNRVFKACGLLSIILAVAFLATLVGKILLEGIPGFVQTEVRLDIYFDPEEFDFAATPTAEEIEDGDYAGMIRAALQERFPQVSGRSELRSLFGLVSSGARFQLADMVGENPDLIGQRKSVWLVASDDVDQLMKGNIDRSLPEEDRRVKDREIAWIDGLESAGDVRTVFDWAFFSSGDSREPELAGIWGALKGSLLTLAVTLAFAFPIGVAAAVYLEEFAPENRWTDLIEVNINNLAAVPSIIFGLLGLAVLLNTFGLPRSTPLVGGLTLALMTLPTIIIASRAAIKAVPPSLRAAAMGLGASPMQVVFHHVVPAALPGILTGTIIGMAQALGETAPLLMIGMVAFVVDIPSGFTEAATALPVQIFLWADSPERAFVEKTSSAIIVLLGFLVAMNALAVFLRNKFERPW